MYKSFPEILIELRKKHKLTQAELSIKLSCSRMYIYLLEKGDRNPSDEFLNKLSNLYGIDLNLYYYDIPFEYRKIYTRFRSAIESNSVKTNQLISKLLEEYEDNDCIKNGEMRNLYLYTKALYYFEKNNFDLSTSICIKALELNNHKLEDLEICSSFFTPTEYCIMILMSMINIVNESDSFGSKTLIKLHENIKYNFFGDDFFISFNLTIIVRVYIILNNNISTMYLEKGDLKKSLLHIDEAINFNHKYYNSSLSHNIYFTKAQCLYAIGDYENTIKSIFQVLANCSTISDELVRTYIHKIETSFPNILEKLNLDHIKQVYL